MDETVATVALLRDPMGETWWPPAVMAAWVVWRTQGEAQKCWHVCRKEPTTLSNVFALERFLRSFMESRDHVPAVVPGEQARDEIECALQEGRLRAEGVIRGEVLSRPLPVSIWQAVLIHFDELLDRRDWPRWHDALFREGDPEPIVTIARVLREDVMKEWPDVYAPLIAPSDDEPVVAAKTSGTGAADDVSVYKTGYPGRPSSAQLIEAELRARASRGEMLLQIAREAAYLEAWLKSEHPSAPSAKAPSIENAIREVYRQLRAPSV